MRGIEHLHPEARRLANNLVTLCANKGLLVQITDTLRTKEEQDKLYAQGRTAPGSIVTRAKYPESGHNWGVAFDFCKNVRGEEYSDRQFFEQVGAVAKSIGLAWGGDFAGFVDRPHLELPQFMPNNSTATLRQRYGTPEIFKATWKTGISVNDKLTIQLKCRFDNPGVVWDLMDKHPYAESLYRKWAESYI